MGKALVVKNVSFLTNKLDTVTLEEEVPCTGVSLNKASASVDDTETLVATVTPNDTTDTVVWTTSDASVATVSNGVVTAVANGTATITATCGEYSATCIVTVAIPMKCIKGVLCNWIYSTTDTYASMNSSAPRAITFGGTKEMTYPVNRASNYEGLYPYPIPEGAKTITFTGANLGSLIVYYNSKEIASGGSSDPALQNVALVVDGETSVGGHPNSIASWTFDTRTFTIPPIEGLDSFTLGLYAKTDTVYSNFDVDNPPITITFGFEN